MNATRSAPLLVWADTTNTERFARALEVDGQFFGEWLVTSDGRCRAWAMNDGCDAGEGLAVNSFESEAAAAQHVVKHAWLAGFRPCAPMLSSEAVLAIDVASIDKDIKAKRDELAALVGLREAFGGEA